MANYYEFCVTYNNNTDVKAELYTASLIGEGEKDDYVTGEGSTELHAIANCVKALKKAYPKDFPEKEEMEWRD